MVNAVRVGKFSLWLSEIVEKHSYFKHFFVLDVSQGVESVATDVVNVVGRVLLAVEKLGKFGDKHLDNIVKFA